MYTTTAGLSDIVNEIKRCIPMRRAFAIAGWRTRYGKRAFCGLCECTRCDPSISFSDTTGLWKCHHCNQGGDIFTLIEKAHGCDFKTALQFLAEEARIELPTKKRLGHAERKRIVRREAERQALSPEAHELKQKERALVKWCRSWIHFCDDLLAMPGPWTEEQWMAAELRDAFLLPEYTLLTYAPASVAKQYPEAGELQRMAMLTAAWRAGGVVTGNGQLEEVVA